MGEEHQVGAPLPGAPPTGRWLLRVFASSRYLVAFAVLGLFFASATLFVYGALVVFKVILETIAAGDVSVDGAKHLQVTFIELTDVFLLGTVLVIVAFGLYQLFLQPGLPAPAWLKIRNLDQLTDKLFEVVVVLLSVSFLAFAVEVGPEAGVLQFGIGVAVVIGALSLLIFVSRRNHHDGGRWPE